VNDPALLPSARRKRRTCAQKFNARYATFGFSDKANLDKGAMWPTAIALKELTPADEAKIAALVKKAVS
jgi:hypothetical protein